MKLIDYLIFWGIMSENGNLLEGESTEKYIKKNIYFFGRTAQQF
jgi:hypothetical protein